MLKGYWTKSLCELEAEKYKTISEFKKYSGGAYNASKKNGWLNINCIYFQSKIKKAGYWTKEKCYEESLKYAYRGDFREKSKSAYAIACRNGWINDICVHMINVGNRYNKCIYSYEFSDNHVYVGLTYNVEKRAKDRMKCKTDSVTIHIKNSGLEPIFKQLTDYISVDKSIILEGEYVERYRNDGWEILNKVKTGSIGSVSKWNFINCKRIANNYAYKSDFIHNAYGAYQWASTNGYLDEICQDMILKTKSYGYWNKEKCKEEFQKYKTKKEIRINSATAYSVSSKNGWIAELSNYMMRN
jgi:hypothetical protein